MNQPKPASLLDGVKMSVGTLTIIPTGRFQSTHTAAGVAMTVAPLAVLPLAIVVSGLAGFGSYFSLQPAITAVLIVGFLAWGTRAMHLDALADVTDGLGGGWTHERARAILKTGDVGPMGVVSIVVALLLQTAALWSLIQQPRGWLLAGLSVAGSRAYLGLVCRRGLPAMPGSSLGKVVAGSVPPVVAYAWPVVVAAVLALAAPVWWRGVLGALLALVAVLLLIQRCRTRFEGVNGDVMGAAIETAFTILLLALAY